MKTIVKLLIAAAVINACARGGAAAWSYYQFKDAAQQAIVFGGGATTAQLHDEIVRRGQELALPIAHENVQVTRDGLRTVARASYTQTIELFPRYERPFDLSFTVDAMSVTPIRPGDLAP